MRHRIFKFLSTLVRALISSVLRTAVTSITFVVISLVTMNYLGVPLPSAQQLIDKFEAVTRLAEILS
jgi:hypothetical protein